MSEPYVSQYDPHWGLTNSTQMFVWLYDKTLAEFNRGNHDTVKLLCITLLENPTMSPLLRACFNHVLGTVMPEMAHDCALEILEWLESKYTEDFLDARSPETEDTARILHLYTWVDRVLNTDRPWIVDLNRTEDNEPASAGNEFELPADVLRFPST